MRYNNIICSCACTINMYLKMQSHQWFDLNNSCLFNNIEPDFVKGINFLKNDEEKKNVKKYILTTTM